MSALTVRREDETIMITIPASINNTYIEQLLDYLRVKSIAAESQATEEEIVELASEINQSWWQTNKQRFIK
jgi:S-adenosylmethionine synthetase